MNRNTNILCSYLTAATPTFISIACCINVLFDCCPSDFRCMYSYVCMYLCMYVCMYVCIFTCCLFHREFGVKVMNMKLLMKALPTMFENSDKNVRAEVRVGTCHTCRPIIQSCEQFANVYRHSCRVGGGVTSQQSLTQGRRPCSRLSPTEKGLITNYLIVHYHRPRRLPLRCIVGLERL